VSILKLCLVFKCLEEVFSTRSMRQRLEKLKQARLGIEMLNELGSGRRYKAIIDTMVSKYLLDRRKEVP
jgi:hypothetical protein